MYSRDDVLAVAKPRDAWWTVLLTDPIAMPLVRQVANRTRITPAQITGMALGVGAGAAACFVQAGRGWLIVGAVLFYLSFVLDCMDGKLARLKGNGTLFGSWVDFIGDQARFLGCAMALVIGRYADTGRIVYLYLAVFVVFCDLFRYVDGKQVAKVRRSMRRRARSLNRAASRDPAAWRTVHRYADSEAGEERPSRHGPGRSRVRSSRYGRLRDRLLDHRIRTHLVSGIEFQMSVCVIAPLSGAVLPVIVVGGVLMLAFEGVLVYRLWASTKSFTRAMRRVESEVELGHRAVGPLVEPHAEPSTEPPRTAM